jgi:hypothetical protein
MWEKTEISTSSDNTVMIPIIPNDVFHDDDAAISEADHIKQARNKGITIGMLIIAGIIAVCGCGVAIGSALTRILVL